MSPRPPNRLLERAFQAAAWVRSERPAGRRGSGGPRGILLLWPWEPRAGPATCGAGGAPIRAVSRERPPGAQCPASAPGLGAPRQPSSKTENSCERNSRALTCPKRRPKQKIVGCGGAWRGFGCRGQAEARRCETAFNETRPRPKQEARSGRACAGTGLCRRGPPTPASPAPTPAPTPQRFRTAGKA